MLSLTDIANMKKSKSILFLCNIITYSTLYNNAFYLMLNHITNSILGFIFWNIMARYFSPEQVGIGSALVAASGLLAILANMGLGACLIRFIPDSGENAGNLINNSFTLVGLVAVLSTFGFLVNIKYLSPELSFINENLFLSIMFLIFTISTSLSTLTDNSLVAGRAAIYIFFKNIIISMIKLPLPIFVFASLNGFGIFAGSGAAFLIGTILAWLLFLPRIYIKYFPRLVLEKKIIQDMLPYSFANYISNLLTFAPQYIFPLMVLNVLGAKESAYLWIAWMMAMVLAIIPSGVAQALFAEGAHNQCTLSNNGRRALKLSLLFSIPAVGAMFLMGRWLLHFFGPGYADYGTVVARYLSLAIIPQCINIIYITINQVKKRLFLIVIQTGAIAFISLGLGWLLLNRIGLPGVGLAYILAHLIVAMVVILPLMREINSSPAPPKTITTELQRL